jgi:hypothetical protein
MGESKDPRLPTYFEKYMEEHDLYTEKFLVSIFDINLSKQKRRWWRTHKKRLLELPNDTLKIVLAGVAEEGWRHVRLEFETSGTRWNVH